MPFRGILFGDLNFKIMRAHLMGNDVCLTQNILIK